MGEPAVGTCNETADLTGGIATCDGTANLTGGSDDFFMPEKMEKINQRKRLIDRERISNQKSWRSTVSGFHHRDLKLEKLDIRGRYR